jgi:glycosyltransferase involved in cell wall biosynthesis
VLIGPDTTGQQVLAQAVALRIERRVVHKQFATHEELAEAYNAADVFIYPRITKAQDAGARKPGAGRRRSPQYSAFPEFAGGIAYFARDGSAAALEDALESVIFSSEQRSMTRNQGPKRAESYRWPLIASRTMGVLRDVAQSG